MKRVLWENRTQGADYSKVAYSVAVLRPALMSVVIN